MKIPLTQKIINYLASLPSTLFSKKELVQHITEFSLAINEPLNARPEDYIESLTKKKKLLLIEIKKTPSGTLERYALSQPSPHELGLSLKPNAFLSHLSAAHIHGFIKKEHDPIFISVEGAGRGVMETDLEQEAIDESFQKKQRQSGSIYQWQNQSYLLLSAKYSGMAGIEKKEDYTLTDPERTLIDLMVRPAYGNGAEQVLAIFKKAQTMIDADAMIDLLAEMDFIYPYHQSLGWYLSRAGCADKHLQRLKQTPMPYRFYLEYEMKDPSFDSVWNIYYPATLNKQS